MIEFRHRFFDSFDQCRFQAGNRRFNDFGKNSCSSEAIFFNTSLSPGIFW